MRDTYLEIMNVVNKKLRHTTTNIWQPHLLSAHFNVSLTNKWFPINFTFCPVERERITLRDYVTNKSVIPSKNLRSLSYASDS